MVVTFLGWSKAGLNQLYLPFPILESRDYRFKLKVRDVLESGTTLLFTAVLAAKLIAGEVPPFLLS